MSVLTGAAAPSDASHVLKSRFMPYLNTTEQSASLPLALSSACADGPQQEVALRIGRDDARDVGRIDDDRALLLEHGDGLGHHLRLLGVQAAARSLRARRRRRVVEERPRNADPRAFQATAIEEARVVAVRRRRARSWLPASFGSGVAPSSTPSRMAASVTVLAIGPAVSWSAVIGMTP